MRFFNTREVPTACVVRSSDISSEGLVSSGTRKHEQGIGINSSPRPLSRRSIWVNIGAYLSLCGISSQVKNVNNTGDLFKLHRRLRDVGTWAALRAGAGVIVGRGWSWSSSLVVAIRKLGWGWGYRHWGKAGPEEAAIVGVVLYQIKENQRYIQKGVFGSGGVLVSICWGSPPPSD